MIDERLVEAVRAALAEAADAERAPAMQACIKGSSGKSVGHGVGG